VRKALSIIFIVVLLINVLSTQGQSKVQNKILAKKNTDLPAINPCLRPMHIAPFEIANNGDTINITDDNNYKQGLWMQRTPARFSELEMLQVGIYFNNKKTGYWETYEGHAMVAKEHFKENILDGEVRYYDEEKLITIGAYKGIDVTKKYDTINVYNPATNADTVVIMLAQKGSIKSGDWQYFENGTLFKTETYFLGELYDTKYVHNILPADSAYVNKRKQYLEQGIVDAQRPFSKYSKGKGVVRYTDLPSNGKGIVPNVRVKK
jgi:antitoxin component YwqK of YwqJK toxin-antitoxin module